MSSRTLLPLALPLLAALAAGCIAPSVLEQDDRAVALDGADVAWSAGDAGDLPGTYVSTEITGPLATTLRKVVYLFEASEAGAGSFSGTYTGAGLVDGDPPRFQSVDGSWTWEGDGLRLDAGPPARVEVAPDGSLRLSGEEGRIVLRREQAR